MKQFLVRTFVPALQLALIYLFLFKTATYLNIVQVAQAPLWGCVQTCQVIGPYGVPWWLFYHLATLQGYPAFQILMILLDTLVLGLVWKLTGFTNSILFTASNIFVLIWIPGNLLVFWISGLSKRFWPLTILAFCTYLPIGAPMYVWTFIWNSSFGQFLPLNLVFNILRYSVIGLWMISGLLWKLFLSRHVKGVEPEYSNPGIDEPVVRLPY